MLKNRRIRIDVASNENDRKRGGRMDMGRDRPDRPEVSMGDWRSGPRAAESSESERRNFSRDSFREGNHYDCYYYYLILCMYSVFRAIRTFK